MQKDFLFLVLDSWRLFISAYSNKQQQDKNTDDDKFGHLVGA